MYRYILNLKRKGDDPMKTLIVPAQQSYNNVVRVAVNNNFNCTEAEYKQLAEYVIENPDRFFFVNCNIKTPGLLTLNKHPYQAVITVNPDLVVRESEIARLYELDRRNVAFTRVKYIPESTPIVDLIKELSEDGYPVVITAQRFNGKRNLLRYSSTDHYEFSCNRYRLNEQALKKVHSLADSTPGVYVCDRKGLGCRGCGLCAKLTVGRDLPITSLNMSSSGICKFNCVDCYAKTMQHFLSRIGMPLIKYDVIKKNSKQSGRTEHIKRNKAALQLV